MLINRVKRWNTLVAWNISLPLIEILETPTTLTLTQTRAPALRDLRNLLIKTWHLPFALFAAWFAYSAEASSPLLNHGRETNAGGWDDPVCLWTMIVFGLPIGRLLLRSIWGLFGRATLVFDKGRDTLLRNGRPVGSLGEICAVIPQITKGRGYNPVFRLVLELLRCRKVVVAETHYIPGRGDPRVINNCMGPNSSFAYLSCWLDFDRQEYVPFIAPEIAGIERRILLFLEKQGEG